VSLEDFAVREAQLGRWCPQSMAKENLEETIGKWGLNGIYSGFMIAKLVNITPISLWFIGDISN